MECGAASLLPNLWLMNNLKQTIMKNFFRTAMPIFLGLMLGLSLENTMKGDPTITILSVICFVGWMTERHSND